MRDFLYHTYFSNHSISDLADNLVKSGYNALVIDEVHKYENWSRELKQIYDIHSELKVILTGSSILDIQKGEVDLSRRIVIYEMYGLSFREYLKMFHNINAETYSLEDILNHTVSLKELAHHCHTSSNISKRDIIRSLLKVASA